MSEICLLNDSFPPVIDGVANAVTNYARVLNNSDWDVSVVTPDCPGSDDSAFPYPVIRYPSIDLRESLGYTAGNPFSIKIQQELAKHDIALLHSHCPIMSNILARQIRDRFNVPMVMTYHTKFDIDIANAVSSKVLQEGAIKALVANVSACDELWVVSRGAGENIKSLGYEGEYIVMENGVDMPKHQVSDAKIIEATSEYDLPDGLPVFLFVGRLMWYKGIRIILDALAALKSQDLNFRMVFVGGGMDADEIHAYTEELQLGDKCIFTGPLHDREMLAAWYCRADLLLFPSTFDTNGLVVREAAACSLASVLVKGSCAAEGVTDRQNALLIDENAASLAVCLARLMENREYLHSLGSAAADDLYISWDTAVDRAMDRYNVVIDNYKSGVYEKHRNFADDLFTLQAELLNAYDKIDQRRKNIADFFDINL